MKHLVAFSLLALAFTAAAQPKPPVAIKGTIDIKYNTRQSGPGVRGVKDVYTVNVNFSNSSLFHGTITDTPQIIDGWINKTVVQPRALDYDFALDVVNPHNPTQTRNVGRMYGTVPISSDGVYHYDTGSLQVDVLPMGNAGGFTSKFDGTAAGKPLTRPSNWQDMLRETVNITRQINGRNMRVVLNKYDKMDFRNHIIAAGPVQIYQPVTVNGQMLYAYDPKNCWFFNNFTVQYAEGGVVKIDRIAGTIRWIEDADRATTGKGHYEFDIRVNEPPPSDSAAFSAPSDESAFFETDSSIPGITGTMQYLDTLRGDTTMASHVDIALTGNNITKMQAMVLTKVILFSCIVPMNSD